MNVQIKLKYNNGFVWFSNESTHIKGYASTPDNHFLQGADLLQYFKNRLSDSHLLKDIITSLNGVFTVIYCDNKKTNIYCDKTRFFPVFYRIDKESVMISDEPRYLILPEDKLNPISIEEFRCTGIVTDKDTLINNIYQATSGNIVILSNNKTEVYPSFSHKVSQEEITTYVEPSEVLKERLERTFQRLAQSLKGHTPVVPLSGGYDSRLIACMLKKYGFDNTICFTYGRKNEEVVLSKKVATNLGFTWYFVDYPKIVNELDLPGDADFQDYYHYASRLTSMFYLQEYPAMKYLIKHSLIPKDSIFIPGHAGDLLAGSHLIKAYSPNLKPLHVAETILFKKYIHYPNKQAIRNEFIKKISNEIGDLNKYLGYSIFEDWDIKERVAKFIFNSSQVFTFFNYPVRFPFWDNELVEFFRCLPIEYKINKKLYDKILRENYFNKFNVNFSKELSVSILKMRIQNFKDKIKIYLPQKLFKKRIIKNDWICYHEMSLFMMHELNKKQQGILPYKSYNSILINWYLKKVSEPERLIIK